MKKFLVLLLAVCLVGTAVLGFNFGADGKLPMPAVATAEAAVQNVETEEPAAGIDYEAVYALHEPDEVVLTVGDKNVTWGEYFYYLYRQAQSVENYLTMMSSYGMPVDWNDAVDEEGEATYLDLTMDSAKATAQSLAAMQSFAEKIEVELSEENWEQIETKAAEDYAAACGEGATRDDFEAYLETIYLPVSLYDRMNELSALYQNGYVQLYGENGEKLSDEETLAYLESNEYMAANHILFMTIDPATYESLDEEAVAAKKAQAEEVAAELQAIADTEELLRRFAELKEELDEDTGKVVYPDGYIFVPGEMVPEFENTAKGQEAYQVSDPVQSSYGYHVILTLPLDPDAVLQYSNDGTAMTARGVASNEIYAKALDDFTQEQETAFVEGFEPPVLTDFINTNHE